MFKKINMIREDPLTKAVKAGNFELCKQIVQKSGLKFCKQWMEGFSLLCLALRHHHIKIAVWLISKRDCRINQIDKLQNIETPLHLAAQYNDFDVVHLLINKGAKISAKNENGDIPLHISCRNQNIQMSKLLIEESLADTPNKDLTTPFHIAAMNNDLETVDLLLSYKINVNACTLEAPFKGFTALHIAIMKGYTTLVRNLLAHGADVDAFIGLPIINPENNCHLENLSYKGYLPLHLAVQFNNVDIVKLLLSYNAEFNAPIEMNGPSPLSIAIKNDFRDIIELFEVEFKQSKMEESNALHLAIENDWQRLASSLIKNHSNINFQNSNGETPLFLAIEKGDQHIVEMLLEKKADVNIKNHKKQTPLHIAAEFSAEFVEMLLQAGAWIDEIDSDNNTALCYAVKSRELQIVQKLLEYQPNIKNSGNKAALKFAINNYSEEYLLMIKLLVEAGFTADLHDSDFSDLLVHAVANRCSIILQHILEKTTNKKDVHKMMLLHRAVKEKNLEVIELLIKHGFDVNLKDQSGLTPLQIAIDAVDTSIISLLIKKGANVHDPHVLLLAAKKKNVHLIQELLNYGVDINSHDEYGTTALHFAIWNNDYELLQLLLNKNACINTTENIDMLEIIKSVNSNSYLEDLKNQIVTSPLHISIAISQELTNILLEYHANVNAKDAKGRTALHLACAKKTCNQKNIIESLLIYGADINACDNSGKLPLYYIYNHACVCNLAFQNEYEIFRECDCNGDFDVSEIVAVFVRQITLMNELNEYVNENNLNLLRFFTFDLSEKLFQSCISCMSLMKKENIYGNITFLDILSKNSNALAACVRNVYVVEAFESSNYDNRFKMYSDMLKKRFSLAVTRKELLSSTIIAFNKLLRRNIPLIVTDKIFNYLHLNDLKNIILSYCEMINELEIVKTKNVFKQNSSKKLKFNGSE